MCNISLGSKRDRQWGLGGGGKVILNNSHLQQGNRFFLKMKEINKPKTRFLDSISIDGIIDPNKCIKIAQ